MLEIKNIKLTDFSMEERCKNIINDCLLSLQKNPLELFYDLANKNYIRIYGPEHHILDGACVLTSFYNLTKKIDLKSSLEKLMTEGLKMPGATCGLWGVCGSASSVGAALSIIEGTGPLSTDETFKLHMEVTSNILKKMSQIGGPRCCKRHAFISITEAVLYLNKRFSISIPILLENIKCVYSQKNGQCLKQKCPFFESKK